MIDTVARSRPRSVRLTCKGGPGPCPAFYAGKAEWCGCRVAKRTADNSRRVMLWVLGYVAAAWGGGMCGWVIGFVISCLC